MSEIEKVTPALGNAGAGGDTKVAGLPTQPVQQSRLIPEGSQVDPLPHPGTSIDFLRRYSPEGPWLLVAIEPETRAIEAASFTPEGAGPEAAARWIAERDNKKNLYFTLNEPSRGLRKKAAKEHMMRAHVLHVDIDVDAPHADATPGAKAEHIESERRKILERLTSLDESSDIPPPSVIIDSGGGYWGIWFLDQPYMLGGSETHATELERYNRALNEIFGGDHCHNVDRIARLPYTTNIPDKKKAAQGRSRRKTQLVSFNTSRRYSLGDFPRADSDVRQSTPSVPVAVSESTLPSALPEWARQLIVAGEVEGREYLSRSEALFAALCELYRAGASREIAIAVATCRDFKISASVLEKRDSRKYASRQVDKAYTVAADGWPEVVGHGRPRPNSFQNARAAILKLGLECRKDVFRDKHFIEGHGVFELAGELSDDALVALRKLIIDKHRFDPGKDALFDAVQSLCIDNRYHPIRDYLDGLVWDGVSRLDSWVVDYLGCDDTELNRTFGKLCLLGAVRRIRQPGHKFDQIVVLEGPEGINKSSAIKVLAGDYFSDQTILAQDDKTVQEQLRGVWLYEIAELANKSRADIDWVKAFASRDVDRARGAYRRVREDVPRQCIFFATTNDESYLKSRTGNRRFWPLKVSKIDLVRLRRDRDQLWAEAAHVEAVTESIFLPERLYDAARSVQAARIERDGISEAISEISRNSYPEYVVEVNGEERIPARALYEKVLSLSPDKVTTSRARQIAQVMRENGWSGPKDLRFGPKRSAAKGYARRVELPLDEETA